jgi:glutathione peroxidase
MLPSMSESLCNSREMNARISGEVVMKLARNAIASIFFIAVAAAATLPNSAPAPHKSVYDFSLVGLDGKEVPLSSFKGKVLLIVNLASQSIYKSQISSLEDLQKSYADKGLIVIGIPSGDFGAQELADNAAIQHFYVDAQHVTFPVFSKASLRGNDRIPLVHLLTDPKTGAGGGDIHWNFTKFLVDREGQPVLRFEADSDPADPEFRVKLEQVLNGTYKKKESSAKESAPPAGDDDSDDE